MSLVCIHLLQEKEMILHHYRNQHMNPIISPLMAVAVYTCLTRELDSFVFVVFACRFVANLLSLFFFSRVDLFYLNFHFYFSVIKVIVEVNIKVSYPFKKRLKNIINL